MSDLQSDVLSLLTKGAFKNYNLKTKNTKERIPKINKPKLIIFANFFSSTAIVNIMIEEVIPNTAEINNKTNSIITNFQKISGGRFKILKA